MLNFIDRIEINPRVCNGKPVIKGARIPVSVILEQIAEGESWEKVLTGYPELKRNFIRGKNLIQNSGSQQKLIISKSILDRRTLLV